MVYASRVKSRLFPLHILAYYLTYVETSSYDTYPEVPTFHALGVVVFEGPCFVCV